MDLLHVTAVHRPTREADLPAWTEGDAFIGGGTWLFSEPQPAVRRLIDLSALDLPPVTETDAEILIAANCTYRQLEARDWSGLPAAAVFAQSIRSLSSSWKTYGLATVGGNIGLAFAKGMMTPVFITLDATYELALAGAPDASPRLVPAAAFQTGLRLTVLRPGEYVRRIRIPRAAFARHLVLRRSAHHSTSHVTAMVIAAHDPATGARTLTLSGALAAPVRLAVDPATPLAAQVDAAVSDHALITDTHAGPTFRRHLLRALAADALAALDHAP